ncbi:MAG: ribonuclease H-like domain-containing protein [Dehalococcoidia bacterium]
MLTELVRALGFRRGRQSGPSSTVVFDLETIRGPEECGGWEHADRFGLAVGVTWCEAEGFREWFEPDAGALVEYLGGFDRVVGFNVIGFDYSVLSAYDAGVRPLLESKTLDLLADVHQRLGRRIKLDDLCAQTLGMRKSGSGADSLRWWRDGERERVTEYCRDDVRLTRDLYLHGRKRGFVRYPRRGSVHRIKVRWKS